MRSSQRKARACKGASGALAPTATHQRCCSVISSCAMRARPHERYDTDT